MTEDFKSKILKYLTGNLEEETGTNEPIFNLEEKTISKNLKNNITALLTSQESATFVSIYGKVYNETIENFLVYGRYNASSNFYGYIAIIDKSLNIVSLLTTFDSGTKIYPFISLQQDENGNFYALTHGYSSVSQDYRVCLFNNILSSGILNNIYKVKLRQSYFVPNSTNYRFSTARQNRIIKIPNEPVYYITFHNLSNETLIIKLAINVGAPNDWELNTINYFVDMVQFGIVPSSKNGETTIYFYGLDISTSQTVWFRYFTITNNTVTEGYNSNLGFVVSSIFSQIYSIGINTAYLSLADADNYRTILYKFDGQNLQTIIIFPWDVQSNGSYLYLETIDNTIFLKLRMITSTNSIISVGILENDTPYFYQVVSYNQITSDIYDYADFYITSNFNMKHIYVPVYGDNISTIRLTMLYNQFNYNGLEYENTNSMVPNSAILFEDSDDPDIIFARNLYNLNINNNTTVSTVEIPNTFLNDTTILGKELWSQTNTILIFDITPITKNIYEVLHINFFNTLLMKNSNNPNNEILNNLGATRLNQSISSTNDYTDTIANKIRINYEDGTNVIQKIGTPTITNNVATYTITIYVPKAITNIEIISNDENTSYQTITGTFDINKYYTLTQDVRVE
jgi:hypothetical protein